MLDLKKLEERLDSALLYETTESLKQWLLNSRKEYALSEFLGEGDFVEMEEKNGEFACNPYKSLPSSCFSINMSNNNSPNYSLAA